MRASIEDLISASMVNRIRLYEHLGFSDEFILEAIRGVLVDPDDNARRPANRTERDQVAAGLRNARAENRMERDKVKAAPSDDDYTRRRENYLTRRSSTGVASTYNREKTGTTQANGVPLPRLDYGDDKGAKTSATAGYTVGAVNTKYKSNSKAGRRNDSSVGASVSGGSKTKLARTDAHSGHINNAKEVAKSSRANQGKTSEGDAKVQKRAGYVYSGNVVRPSNPAERKQLADAIKHVRKHNRGLAADASSKDVKDEAKIKNLKNYTKGYKSMKPYNSDENHPLERREGQDGRDISKTSLGYKMADSGTSAKDGKRSTGRGMLKYPRAPGLNV